MPDYERVRNVLEHFDEYDVGDGDLPAVNKALASSVHSSTTTPTTASCTSAA